MYSKFSHEYHGDFPVRYVRHYQRVLLIRIDPPCSSRPTMRPRKRSGERGAMRGFGTALEALRFFEDLTLLCVISHMAGWKIHYEFNTVTFLAIETSIHN